MIYSQIIGYLGADVIHHQKDNQSYYSFSLATQSSHQKDKVTLWIKCITYNHNLVPFLKKGTRVFVSGVLQVKAGVNKNNEPISYLSLFTNNIEFLSQLHPNDEQQHNHIYNPPNSTQESIITNDFNTDGNNILQKENNAIQDLQALKNIKVNPIITKAEQFDEDLPF